MLKGHPLAVAVGVLAVGVAGGVMGQALGLGVVDVGLRLQPLAVIFVYVVEAYKPTPLGKFK